jgi:hypothetical protein
VNPPSVGKTQLAEIQRTFPGIPGLAISFSICSYTPRAGVSPTRSDPQIDLSDVFFPGKFLWASFTNRAAMLQDVDAISNPQRRGRVLLDEQNGRAVARDPLNGVEDHSLEPRRDADRGLVQEQSSGRPINARPMATICCSPPDSVPDCCHRRSRKTGNNANTRSISASIAILSLRR